jgi:O-antigen biosynthesis protein
VCRLLSSEIADAANQGILSARGISGSVSQSVILKLSTSTNAAPIQSIGDKLASNNVTLLMKRRFLGTLKGLHKDLWCGYEHFSRRIQRAYEIIRDQGFATFAKKSFLSLRKFSLLKTYGCWISAYDTLDWDIRQRLEIDSARLPSKPAITILVIVSDNNTQSLIEMVGSLQNQIYPHWQLSVVVGASGYQRQIHDCETLERQDTRIRVVHVEEISTPAVKLKAALKLASGEFVALAEQGDILAEQALYWVAKELNAYPDSELIFSDEDQIDAQGARSAPWFKSDWNPALMLSCNAFGRLGVFRRSLLERAGGIRADAEEIDEHELVLRCARSSDDRRIRHIPHVLYHRRIEAPEDTRLKNSEAGRRAVAEHLAALNIDADVRLGRRGYEVRYPMPSPPPRVSIVVATTAQPSIVEPCLKSLLERTTYSNFEIVLLVANHVRQKPERDFLLLRYGQQSNVRIVEYPDQPFNYSWVNNQGATQASGDILCFLNDDTEVITPDWLEQLVARSLLPRVAAAGPMLYYPNGSIQHAGVILGLSGIAGHACHREPRGSTGYFGRACLEQDVSCVTAACMTIRADVFRAVGGFDNAMPLAYNDVDLCLRLRTAGWRIIWTPAAELIHHESSSLGAHNARPNTAQFSQDVALMRQRWSSVVNADPFYNPNLSLDYPHTLAFPPRHLAEQQKGDLF